MITVRRAKRGAACKDCVRRKRKCTHSALVVQQRNAAEQETTLLYHIPMCTEFQLCREFVDTIKSLRLDHLWLSMVPCRLGTNETVDSAITALVRNRDLTVFDNSASQSGGLKNYIEAVVRLRTVMDRPECSIADNALLTVALICVCEAVMKSDMSTCFAHWCGMGAILLNRPRSYPATELTRAILYHIRNQTFHIPIALGKPSPFDEPRWYTLEPAGTQSLPAEILTLKRRSHELLIRLPRLVTLLRKIRNSRNILVEKQAIGLARELAALQDYEAENKLLHSVRIVKTENQEDHALIPCSFEYSSLGQLETAVVYWKYFILLFNISLKLNELVPESRFDTESLKTDMQRMGTNVAMSWQYAKPRKQRAHSRGHVAVPTAFLFLYGMFKHIDEFRGVSVDRWRKWTLDRQNDVNIVWSIVKTEADLEEANELLLGGPLTGMFVAAYTAVPFWVRHRFPKDDDET